MNTPKISNIVIEKINLDRFDDFYNAFVESSKEWFASGMIPKPDLSRDELEYMIKSLAHM